MILSIRFSLLWTVGLWSVPSRAGLRRVSDMQSHGRKGVGCPLTFSRTQRPGRRPAHHAPRLSLHEGHCLAEGWHQLAQLTSAAWAPASGSCKPACELRAPLPLPAPSAGLAVAPRRKLHRKAWPPPAGLSTQPIPKLDTPLS